LRSRAFTGKISPVNGQPTGRRIVTRARTVLGLFFFLFVLTQGSASALTDVEWSNSVQAAEAIEPTLSEPPLTGTDVSVIGGGVSATAANFAFSAFRRDGEVSGRMTLSDRLGNNFSADVVCITAVVAPDGRGGLARLVGRLTEPQFATNLTMFFDVFDSNLAGGGGDLLNVSSSPLPPEEFPCFPTMPVDPVANGNIAVRSLG
jgi:hypothetical protein